MFCRLVKDTDKKALLVLDNLRVHHSKKTMAWIVRHKYEIELFCLSIYAQEYNPSEYLNSDLRCVIGNRATPHSEHDLEYNIRSHMKSVQLNCSKIQSFFHLLSASCVA